MSAHVPLDPETEAIADQYRDLLTNTGGNDPLGLLIDLQPYVDDRPNRLMTTNIVRFVLAVGIETQVSLIRVLIAKGMLPPLKRKFLP